MKYFAITSDNDKLLAKTEGENISQIIIEFGEMVKSMLDQDEINENKQIKITEKKKCS